MSSIRQFFIKNNLNININILEGINIENLNGIILNVHGIGSHFQPVYPSIDEFDAKDEFFSKFNFKSFGLEFHGHGKSDGERCAINNFDDLIDDLDITVKYIRQKYKEPIFLLCESMGCAVAFKYCIVKENDIAGVIYLAPLFGIDENLKPNCILENILVSMSCIIPKLQLLYTTSKMYELTSPNKDFIIARANNNYSYKTSHRLCTGREILKISDWIKNNFHLFNKPILIFHGKKDVITDPEITKNLFENLNSEHKKLYLIDDGYHVLLVNNYKHCLLPKYIINKILKWIQKYVFSKKIVEILSNIKYN